MVCDRPILGVDIGGTKCAVAMGTEDGRILERLEMPTQAERGPSDILERLLKLARELLERRRAYLDDEPPLRGIGISCGGPLDTRTGKVYSPPNLPGWEGVPVRDMFEAAFPGVPVLLENDANATALAEWRWGAGRGARNVVYLTQGTGIGGGLILEGRLYRGTNDLAGEVGHQTILPDGPLCGCGKRGCLEALASGPAIARRARERLAAGETGTRLPPPDVAPQDVTARHVVEAAHAGDPLAQSVLAEAGEYMGIGIANLIQILNPETVILGTIAVHAGEWILGPIRRSVEKHAWSRARSVCRIVPAALGDRAQDLAAIALVVTA